MFSVRGVQLATLGTSRGAVHTALAARYSAVRAIVGGVQRADRCGHLAALRCRAAEIRDLAAEDVMATLKGLTKALHVRPRCAARNCVLRPHSGCVVTCALWQATHGLGVAAPQLDMPVRAFAIRTPSGAAAPPRLLLRRVRPTHPPPRAGRHGAHDEQASARAGLHAGDQPARHGRELGSGGARGGLPERPTVRAAPTDPLAVTCACAHPDSRASGSLSPSLLAPVRRASEVEVEFVTERGVTVHMGLKGVAARVFQVRARCCSLTPSLACSHVPCRGACAA